VGLRMATIKLENISKRYGGIEALRDVNLEVEDKEFFCILGPPGAGKTTIFRIIAGLVKPDEGDVYIDDRKVTSLPPKDRDVAMLFETLALYPNKTGYQNIAFPLELRNTPKEEKRVLDTARLLRIEHILDRLPQTFSGGERQRVALAKTIIRRPKVFLLDEPLSNIDALLRVNMRVELKRLKKELGQTIMYAAHDQVEAMSFGERICILFNGEIHQVGTPEEVYTKPLDMTVAEAIGASKINVLDCTFMEKGGKAYLNHKSFMIEVTKFKDEISQTAYSPELALGIRPEDIRIYDKDEKPSKGVAEVTVYVTENLGPKQELEVETDSGDILTAVVQSDKHFEIGDKKVLDFDLDKIYLFDKKTGKNILL